MGNGTKESLSGGIKSDRREPVKQRRIEIAVVRLSAKLIIYWTVIINTSPNFFLTQPLL